MSVVHETVSSPAESLILVDGQDNVLGYRSKAECHQGQGLLHRAFSVFLFNDDNELLLQRRSSSKPLWPLYWSNSCCSHPRETESIEVAGHRRILEELNLSCDLNFLYKFQYQAPFENLGSEHELCYVYYGRVNGTVVAHPEEIAEWRFISPADLSREITANGDQFTPWLKLEWERICRDHLEQILGAT